MYAIRWRHQYRYIEFEFASERRSLGLLWHSGAQREWWSKNATFINQSFISRFALAFFYIRLLVLMEIISFNNQM